MTDPLVREAYLAHGVELSVLGLRTRFESNNAKVIALVEEDFGAWRGAEGNIDPASPDLTVRVTVHDGAEPGLDAIRARSTNDGRLILQSLQSVAIVDPSRHESLAFVSADLLAHEELFREEMLSAATFALLCAFDRHPVHAAAVLHGGRALLLAGESGAGKSTLALLAHLEGFRLMSDDLVWVQLAPALRVWANTRGAHLRADSLEKLSITDVHPVIRSRDGKQRVSLGAVVRREPWVVADDARVCILVPGTRAALDALEPAEVEAALAAQVAPGFDRFPQREPEVLKALAAPGGWRLTVAGEPRDSLPFIETMLGVTGA